MKNVGQIRGAVPTGSRPKFVASDSDKSQTLRRFLAVALRFLRRQRPLCGSGNLSTWILAMHGIAEDGEGRVHQAHDGSVQLPIATWLNQLFGPNLDPRKIKVAEKRSQEIGDAFDRTLVPLAEGGKTERIEHEFDKAAGGVMDAWGVQPEFLKGFEVSIESVTQFLRALRATLFCIDRHRVHPIVLIARASKGNEGAVLDLVRIDKLFLHDRCTVEVIRRAELLDDQAFINRLARAQEYRPVPGWRTVRHAYYSVLFMLESVGVTLPTLHELWRTIDPKGVEYKSLSAFERDFQRRRQDFNDLLATLEAEVPAWGTKK